MADGSGPARGQGQVDSGGPGSGTGTRSPADLSFGQLAIQKQLANWDEVKECLRIQAKLRSLGVTPKPLGQILVEKGYLSEEQVEELLEAQQGAESDRTIQGYEILDLIGKGGMGSVYKARQLSLDRIVALKILPPDHGQDDSFIERFVSEARTVAKLNHENIIAGIDVGESNGYSFFAMEYVDGRTVAEDVEENGPMKEKRAVRLVMQIARALAHAAKHNLVHRDIKPHNIMLTRNDVAKLCDLGLAKPMDKQGIEQEGYSVGTPHYISPEQARGLTDVDIRSDIYSLGATLYHMLCGETPFIGQSPMVLMTKHLTEDPVPVCDRNPDVSGEATAVVQRMMARDREERYQTPVEVIEDLEAVLKGRTPGALGEDDVTPSGRLPEARRRNRQRESNLTESVEQYIDRDAEARKRRRPVRPVRRGGDGGRLAAVLIVLGLIAAAGFAVISANGPSRDGASNGNDGARPGLTPRERAAEAMETLQGILAWERSHPGRSQEAISRLEGFLETYGDTPAAEIARRKVNELRGLPNEPLDSRP